jgi:sugar transferase EpsL
MRRTQRAFDVGASILLLVLMAPILSAVALLVWSRLGRPILFRQTRPGLGGRLFALGKFRTMRLSRAETGSRESDAERLTPLGRFLRATSLDELPTLWNVLAGDMSLVGPRPLLVSYLARYTPEQARRHEVRPGITGWAQVNGRNALSWEEKFRLDVWYVDHASMLLDLKILALTILRVIRRDGISHGGETTMPEFLGTRSSPEANTSSGQAPRHDPREESLETPKKRPVLGGSSKTPERIP